MKVKGTRQDDNDGMIEVPWYRNGGLKMTIDIMWKAFIVITLGMFTYIASWIFMCAADLPKTYQTKAEAAAQREERMAMITQINNTMIQGFEGLNHKVEIIDGKVDEQGRFLRDKRNK